MYIHMHVGRLFTSKHHTNITFLPITVMTSEYGVQIVAPLYTAVVFEALSSIERSKARLSRRAKAKEAVSSFRWPSPRLERIRRSALRPPATA